MRNLDRPNGIWGTILLPIKNNEIDWVAFEEQVKWYQKELGFNLNPFSRKKKR